MGMFRMGWFGVGGTFVDVDGIAEDVDGTAVDVDGTAVDVDGTAEDVNGFVVVVFVGLGVVVKAAAKFIERILGSVSIEDDYSLVAGYSMFGLNG